MLDGHARKVVELLSAHPPCRKIVTRVGISESRLRHLLTEALGISPHRWTLQQRLEAARDLIGSSDLSIKEIAYRVGFNSPAHFTYMFRKRFGLPPRQYRQTIVPQQNCDSPQQDCDHFLVRQVFKI